MMRRLLGFCLIGLCLSTDAAAQDPLAELLKSLQGTGYPGDDAVLSGLTEEEDYRGRIEAVTRILDQREILHGRSDIDDFQKTQIVSNALHLLDAYDLPDVDRVLRRLGEEDDWNRRERDLLAYLCAKRDIHYDANVTYLLASLTAHEKDLESPANRRVAWTVRETCDTLSYLGDLFIRRGDETILRELFAYASTAFGYPAEYFSDRLLGMLLKRPVLFVSCLAGSSDETVRDVTNSIGFGIRNDSIRKSLEDVLNDRLDRVEGREEKVVTRLREEVEALRMQWAAETGVSNP
jgi:hypothetical protein